MRFALCLFLMGVALAACAAPTAQVNLPSPAATRSPESTSVPALAAPAVLIQFKLLDLPGEGRSPVALVQLGQDIYVANRSSDNVAVVQDDAARAYIPIGASPSAIVADLNGNRIYAGTYETPTLYLIENQQVTNQVATGGRINALALDGDDLYVALDNDAIIERYDASTLEKQDELQLSEGFGVSDIAVDKPRNRLYAAIYGKIIALDLAAFRERLTFTVPALYSTFAVNPADGSIWAGGYDGESSRSFVVGFKPDGEEIARLYGGGDLKATVFDNANRLYVLDRYNNKVNVIETPQARLVATIDVNEAPTDAVWDAERNRLVVANQDNDNLSLIDVKTLQVAQVVPLASLITALASDPARSRVYAASGSTNSVYVIEDDKVVDKVKTGSYPVDLALDPTADRVYAASRADGRLTVFDPDTLDIQASEFITTYLSTVAVDPVNRKLFAGSVELDPATLKPVATFYAQGFTLNSLTDVVYERVNPALKKLYGFASNGVPGSNSRITLYRFAYDDLSQSQYLGSKNGGNSTALAIDPSTNTVFVANTHPLAFTHGLDVFDGADTLLESIPLAAQTTAMAVNPATHHLFLAHARSYQPYPQSQPAPDDTIEILDTRTLGRVATLNVRDPWRMTLMDDKVYVASYADGTITVLGDAPTAQPPAPTPTLTPSPYPTWTPILPRTPGGTPPAAAAPPCPALPAEPFRALWEAQAAALGCPTGPAERAAFAVQTFRDGYMFDDLRNLNAKKIYALFPDGTFQVLEDTWREGDPARPCNEIPVPPGQFHPQRGFGKVWCEHPEIRDELPGAVANEAAVELLVQAFAHGMMWANTPRGIVILFDNGTWE